MRVDHTGKPFVEVKTKGVHGTSLRTPTSNELKAANRRRQQIWDARSAVNKAQLHLNKLVKACPHTVSVDAPGVEYDIRSCYACGKDQGLV